MYSKKVFNSLNNLTFRCVNNTPKEKSNYEDLSDSCDQNPIISHKKTRIPWRAICLALFLLIIGTVIIVLSILTSMGFIVSIQPNDGLLVLGLLGLIMFIPGFYHIRIAYYAYYNYDGFDFQDIPDFD